MFEIILHRGYVWTETLEVSWWQKFPISPSNTLNLINIRQYIEKKKLFFSIYIASSHSIKSLKNFVMVLCPKYSTSKEIQNGAFFGWTNGFWDTRAAVTCAWLCVYVWSTAWRWCCITHKCSTVWATCTDVTCTHTT